MKSPTALNEILKALSVIVVHVREEHRVQLFGPYPELRQPHRGAAAGIELYFHGAAVIAILSVTDQRSGGG